jgi:hypothetical protein
MSSQQTQYTPAPCTFYIPNNSPSNPKFTKFICSKIDNNTFSNPVGDRDPQTYTITRTYQNGHEEVMPASLLFHQPLYYIRCNNKRAFKTYIPVHQDFCEPSARLLNELAILISVIPSEYQEINLVNVIALDYLSCS